MKKITSIPTHSFEPISFGDSYLYNQYEKLKSFLQVNFDQNIANFIAKPVITNTEVSWYVNYYSEFKAISEFDQEIQGSLLSKYWDIINTVNSKINTLRSKTNNDQNEWYSLLVSVFDSENNKIYSDGQHIVILWGWKFFNAHENIQPAFIPNPIIASSISSEYIPEQILQDAIIEENNLEDISVTPLIVEDELEEEPIISEEPEIIENDKHSYWHRFLDFLKWFASTYWWLLLLLLLLILFLLLFKSCEKHDNSITKQEIDQINHRIEYLQQKSNECCGCNLNEHQE